MLISIFSTLIINVFVKKGSLIFVKMSEDLQIDAVITPTFRKREPNSDFIKDPNFYRFNYTRIREIQEIDAREKGTNIETHHQFSPRIVFRALNEIKAS